MNILIFTQKDGQTKTLEIIFNFIMVLIGICHMSYIQMIAINLVMFQFVCPKRDPHFKDDPKLSVFFHTMINTNHIFIKSVIGAC